MPHEIPYSPLVNFNRWQSAQWAGQGGRQGQGFKTAGHFRFFCNEFITSRCGPKACCKQAAACWRFPTLISCSYPDKWIAYRGYPLPSGVCLLRCLSKQFTMAWHVNFGFKFLYPSAFFFVSIVSLNLTPCIAPLWTSSTCPVLPCARLLTKGYCAQFPLRDRMQW